MKILLVTHRVRGGGAEEVARAWMHAVVAGGHSCEVLVLDEARGDPDQIPSEVVVHYAQRLGVVSHLGRLRLLRRLSRDRGTEVVVSLQTYPNLLALMALSGQRCKVVISEHNLPSIYLRRGPLGHRLQRQLARLLYRQADFAIGVSHAVAADLLVRHGVRSDRCAVIANGVIDVARKSPRPSSRRPISLVVPARLSWQKRPEMAAAVSEELSRRGRDVSVTWVGDPVVGEPEIPSRVNERISVIPWQDDWWDIVPANSVVLLPSSVEGLGNVLVHAAARGFMSVASSVALGVGDAIVPGVTGYLAVTDSPAAVADAVELATDAVGQGGIQDWLENYSRAATERALNQVFANL